MVIASFGKQFFYQTIICFILFCLFLGFKKINNIINPAWKNDLVLKAELVKLVKMRYNRKEILTLVVKKYKQYAWSLPSLRDRLRYFEIKYINYETPIDSVYV